MLKVGWVFQITEGRHPMSFDTGRFAAGIGRRPRIENAPRSALLRRGPAHGGARAGAHEGRAAQERPPVLAAFSASHHHRLGNPETPVFGQRLRMIEAIPARIALEPERRIAERDSNSTATPDRAPCSARGQLGAILGEDDAVDQGIDRGILDAGQVAASPADPPTATRNNRAARCPATTIAPIGPW